MTNATRDRLQAELEAAISFNDPESPNLSADESLMQHVAHGVEELGRALRTRGLNDAERNLLRRLHEELSTSGVDDLDRRFFRGVVLVTEVVRRWRDAKTKQARVHAARILLVRLESLRFDVYDHWTQDLTTCMEILDRCSLEDPRPKSAIRPAGVLGRVLFGAKWPQRGTRESALVKRINEAVARETKRRG